MTYRTKRHTYLQQLTRIAKRARLVRMWQPLSTILKGV